MSAELDKQDLIDLRITTILNDADERIFQQFDDLHKRGINDDEIIHYLRKQGESDYADRYIEWSGALDPDREDPSTLGGIVPDPGNHPSDIQMQEALSGIKQTGKVNFGGIDIQFGRDALNRLMVRPTGGVWVIVQEEGK